MKKILCLIIAVVIALSSFMIASYAAAPNITMKADKTNAKIGDIVIITVSVAENSGLASATIDLVYDNTFFKVISMEKTDVLGGVVNKDYSENRARYTGIIEGNINSASVLFTAQFEVLKRGGTISAEAIEVYYIANSLFGGKRTDGTGEVAGNLKGQAAAVTCPHAEKEFVSETAATCSTNGKKVEKCKECGKTFETSIAKLPHTMEDVVIKAATCAEEGKQGKKCTVCGAIADETPIAKLPHDMKETVIKAATCTEEGKKANKCTVCGAIADETAIAKLPHDIEEDIIKAATCTEAGKKIEKCKNCDYKSEEKEIPATGHVMKETVIKNATCEATGKKVSMCDNCDHEGEEIVIPATGHTEGKWVIEKYPTKTEPGLEVKKCTVCEKVLDTSEIPANTTYKLGDVNNDGYITAVDARLVLRFVAELSEPTTAQKLAADTNKDGKIGATDARVILRVVAGLAKI